MQTFFHDFRYSLRQLFKSLGFTLTAVISLALGIGATTAVFSVVYAVLMDPYPYAAPDRMVHLVVKDPAGHDQWIGLNAPQFRQVKQLSAVEDGEALDEWDLTLTGHDVPENVRAIYFSSNAFNYFGVPAMLGRGLQPSDAIDGQDPQPVVVLSYKFWQHHFNFDRSVIGQTLQMVHKNYTIVGVAAPRFTWGDGDVYVPLKMTQDPGPTFNINLRLKPGVTRDAADAQLQPLLEQFAKDRPQHFPEHFRSRVRGLNDRFVKDLGGTLYLLFSAVALLLLIGCGNVSILLLARGTVRQHEFAVRMAIGASRRRIVRQLLTESLMLSVTGAAMGVLLAYELVKVIVTLLPQYSFPHEAAIKINLPVLFFSVGIALLTGILFGLSPALQMSRPEVSQVMQSSSRKVVGGVSGRRTHNILIGGQIALTLVMLAGAGAAMKGFVRLMNTSLGYDPHNVMSVGIPVHANTYTTWEKREAYFEQLRARVATVPGVTMTGISTNATPPSNGRDNRIEILGKPAMDQQAALVNFVSPEYFAVLHIPLLQGRIWSETENHNAAQVVVVNETLARRYFPNGDAIGRSLKAPELRSDPPFTVMSPGANQWLQIIGIMADDLDDGLRNPIKPELFVPYTMSMREFTQILVRSQGPPLALLHDVRAQVNKVDADQQTLSEVNDLETWIVQEPEWASEQLVAWLFGAFAVLGLALAAVGLYSVVSYSVAQRTNEFGIRVALGAQRGHVLRIVFSSMVASVSGGIAAGVVLTLALNKVLAKWAEGSSRDPLILLAVTLLLGVVAIMASAVPARRASALDPMAALRTE